MQLILASASARRQELLKLLGIPFGIAPADIDEKMDPALPPEQEVERVSRAKAAAVPRLPGQTVLAADTIVVSGGAVLGKPHSELEARQMLRQLSGRTHQVITGCAIWDDGGCRSFHQVTQVTFRPLTEPEIDDYVRSGEPMDKAGAYGIQGGAALFCREIAGDYYNVVGLPVCRLSQELAGLNRQAREEVR